MRVRKAVITAAGPEQRTLPLQMLVDRDGVEKSVLAILVEEVVKAEVEEICVVVWPGDEAAYLKVAGDHAGRLTFVHQPEPRGYGHAIYCAKDFVKEGPFLQLVGDHLYVNRGERSCAQATSGDGGGRVLFHLRREGDPGELAGAVWNGGGPVGPWPPRSVPRRNGDRETHAH